MSNPVISVKNLNKNYKVYVNSKERIKGAILRKHDGYVKKALSDVSFDVNKGEIVGLYGSRGSGRTTLVRIIGGITYPTNGTIDIDGRITYINGLTYGFDLEMTGRQNIYVKGSALGIAKSKLKDLEQEIIEFSEMKEIIDMPMKSYRAGFAARLGFAILFAFKHEVLIIDDGLIFGDKVFKEKCIRKLKEVMDEGNSTMIITTNQPILLKQLCTRAILMDAGTIIFDGDPDEAVAYAKENLNKRTKKKNSESEEAEPIENDDDNEAEEDEVDEI